MLHIDLQRGERKAPKQATSGKYHIRFADVAVRPAFKNNIELVENFWGEKRDEHGPFIAFPKALLNLTGEMVSKPES